MNPRTRLEAGAATLCLFLASVPVAAQDSEWPVTTGDRGGQRYAPLDQIDAGNVGDLEIAWRWSSPDNDRVTEDRRLRSRRMQPGGNQVTPIKIGDRLYATTGLSQIAALDPATGETEWVYDPEAYDAGRPTNLGFVHRGASYWAGRPAATTARKRCRRGFSTAPATPACWRSTRSPANRSAASATAGRST